MRSGVLAGLACAVALACCCRSPSAASGDHPRPAPAPPLPPSTGPLRPGPGPGSPVVRACVDRELERRRLNAYGDPPDMVYPQGPPVEEDRRVEYVTQRYPDIRTACGVGPW